MIGIQTGFQRQLFPIGGKDYRNRNGRQKLEVGMRNVEVGSYKAEGGDWKPECGSGKKEGIRTSEAELSRATNSTNSLNITCP